MEDIEPLLQRLDRIADALEGRVRPASTDWDAAVAFRWRGGRCQPVAHRHVIRLDDLLGVDAQKAELARNTAQFVAGRPANNVLLTGARGTGKSSLVKAVLDRHAGEGLRLIEVDREELAHLPDIVDRVAASPRRFIVYCDDLAFDEDEPGYRALKAVLDGSVAAPGDNLLIYATSNRRHLMPEYQDDNLPLIRGGEIHPREAVEEKVSLSERFGLWVSFHAFDQDEYLAIAAHWLAALGWRGEADAWRGEALRWALSRGARNGRVAAQFARDFAGRKGLGGEAASPEPPRG
ncbi:MAG: ATP-binding protein [Rhodocyclaceae bacterium]|nr:ATP-binding protein [Rhodocyclaceae bacterium]